MLVSNVALRRAKKRTLLCPANLGEELWKYRTDSRHEGLK